MQPLSAGLFWARVTPGKDSCAALVLPGSPAVVLSGLCDDRNAVSGEVPDEDEDSEDRQQAGGVTTHGASHAQS